MAELGYNPSGGSYVIGRREDHRPQFQNPATGRSYSSIAEAKAAGDDVGLQTYNPQTNTYVPIPAYVNNSSGGGIQAGSTPTSRAASSSLSGLQAAAQPPPQLNSAGRTGAQEQEYQDSQRALGGATQERATDRADRLAREALEREDASRKEGLTSAEILRREAVGAGETRRLEGVATEEARRREGVTSAETLRKEGVTSAETRRLEGVTSAETLRREGVASAETLRTEKVARDEELRKEQVARDTEQRRLDQIKGLTSSGGQPGVGYGGGGVSYGGGPGGGGGGGIPQFGGGPSIMPPGNLQGARDAAYARAKDITANQQRASLNALRDVAAEQGTFVAGGDNPALLGAEANLLSHGANQMGEFNRQQLLSDLEQAKADQAAAARRAEVEYQGGITQRGQNMGQLPSLIGLLTARSLY